MRSISIRNRFARIWRGVRSDAGQAMIVVLGIMMILAIVPVVVYNQVSQNIPITLSTQDSKAALLAAQSGVSAYMLRLQNDPSYVEYNDLKANVPPNDPAYFTPDSWSAFPPVMSSGNTQWANVPGASTALNEQYSYNLDVNPSNGNLVLFVVGKAGTGPGALTQYRTLEVGLSNPALSWAYFSNYNTASPYIYANSYWFKSMMQLVNWLTGFLGSSGLSTTVDGMTITGSEVQTLIGEILGKGPGVPEMELGALLCNYHSYDQNMLSSLLHTMSGGVYNAVYGELSKYGITSISILGWNVGEEIASWLAGEVQSVTNWVVGNIPEYGPFPLVCNTNDNYGTVNPPYNGNSTNTTSSGGQFSYGGTNGYNGGYYGLNTTFSGQVMTNDSIYTCGSSNMSSADVTFGQPKSTFTAAGVTPLDGVPATQFPYIANNLPNVTIPQINLGIFGTYGPWTLLVGCNGTKVTPKSVTYSKKPLTPPEPDFTSLQAIASNGSSGNPPGCSYTGPTVIQLEGTQMQVWAPDGGNCNSTGVAIPIPSNGVIYVHNLCTLPPSSCSQTPGSFSSNFALASQNMPIQNHSPYWGDAIVQGTLGSGTTPENLTISASNDIVVTGNITYGGSGCTTNGGETISVSCPDTLGLAPGGNVPYNNYYQDSSGNTYYPQGNVVINHPITSSNDNWNNCAPVYSTSSTPQFGSTVNGTTSSCSNVAPINCPGTSTIPAGPCQPPDPPSGSCGPGNLLPLIGWGSANVCIYDIASYIYNIEYSGFFCNLGNEIESVFGAQCQPTAGLGKYPIGSTGNYAVASSLYANDGVSNPSAAPHLPQPPTLPTCNNPAWSVHWQWSWPPIALGSCTQQWFTYYANYGVIGIQTFQQICSDFGFSCTTGFEGALQNFESTWVHGLPTSFPAVYDPVINAAILASNSQAQIQQANNVQAAGGIAGLINKMSGQPSLPAVQNGSFALMNPYAGNQFIEPNNANNWQSEGIMHGLGTLYVTGSVVEQYNNGLQSAGLTSSHFELLKLGTPSLWQCSLICYVPAGFRNVYFSHSPNLMSNPPAGLLSNTTGDGWSEASIQEVQPLSSVVPFAP